MHTPTKRQLRGLQAIVNLARADVECAEPGDKVIGGASRRELHEAFAWLNAAIAEGDAVRRVDERISTLLKAQTLRVKAREP